MLVCEEDWFCLFTKKKLFKQYRVNSDYKVSYRDRKNRYSRTGSTL